MRFALDKHFEMTLSSPEKGHCAVTFIDITEKVKTIETLRRSEEQFRLAMNVSGDGMWDWSIPIGHISYSPEWAKILGYDCPDDTGNI